MGKKKGKGKADPADGGDATPEGMLKRADAEATALRLQLDGRSDDLAALESRAAASDCKAAAATADAATARRELAELTRDMTRQYKANEETLVDQLKKLEVRFLRAPCAAASPPPSPLLPQHANLELRDLVTAARVDLEQTTARKDKEIDEARGEAAGLRRKMDDMIDEFGTMLGATLSGLQGKMEVGGGLEVVGEVPVKKQMMEFNVDAARAAKK